MRDSCAYRGVLGDGPSNAANCIFPPTDSRCHANEIWDKIGYNSACVKDICEIIAPIGRGGFEYGPLNTANCIFPIDTRCHGTKFGTKLGLCTRYLRDFCVYGGFSGMGHWMLPIAFSPTDPLYHGNEIFDKIGYNSVTVVIVLATVRKNLKRNIFVTDQQ